MERNRAVLTPSWRGIENTVIKLLMCLFFLDHQARPRWSIPWRVRALPRIVSSQFGPRSVQSLRDSGTVVELPPS